MEYRDIIQKSIDYIDENLTTEITGLELSKIAGYSIYHFYRLFHISVGMPVMQYILRRRLLYAVYQISLGYKMVGVVLLYGFDTYAGFYKAFQREFGYTPSAYIKSYKVKKPYRINLFQEERIIMTHKRVKDILKQWGLEKEELRDIFYDTTGYHNENAYYVGNEFVIKVTNNLGNLRNHIELSKSIQSVGLLSATAITTLAGNEYIQEGELYFYVTKRLTGSHMNAEQVYMEDYKKSSCFIGEIIGQLHVALNKCEVVVNEVNIFSDVTNWALPKVKLVLDVPRYISEGYQNIFSELYPLLPKQVIHRDPNPSNIIVSDGSWGFIDFELSEKNIRLYDPCYAATAILVDKTLSMDKTQSMDETLLIRWIEIYKNIIWGFDSVLHLSEEELKAVPYVILSNQLICVAWFMDKDKYIDMYDGNLRITKWIIDNFDKLALI